MFLQECFMFLQEFFMFLQKDRRKNTETLPSKKLEKIQNIFFQLKNYENVILLSGFNSITLVSTV